jgi:peptidoglycan/LPS O-acetylase OafA/YrhL
MRIETQPKAHATHRRLDFLDAVRGLAALAVVAEHELEHFYPNYFKWSSGHFSFGIFGVIMFFLVSGFIIPVSLERYKSLREFWKSRVFRLYPLYWVSIVIALIWGRMGWLGLPAAYASQPVRTLLVNITMLQTFVAIPNLMGVYWTLSLELAFYALCSALFLAGVLRRSLSLIWLAALLNLVACVSYSLVLHKSLPAGQTGMLVTMFFGTLLYRCSKGDVSIPAVMRVVPVLIVSIVIGIWIRFIQYPNATENRSWFFCTLISFAAAYVLFVICYSLRGHAFPKPLQWLGRVSYSLYLLHGPVLVLVPAGSHPFLRFAFVMAASIVVAGISFRFIEQPAIQFHRRQIKSAQSSSTILAVAA